MPAFALKGVSGWYGAIILTVRCAEVVSPGFPQCAGEGELFILYRFGAAAAAAFGYDDGMNISFRLQLRRR